MKVTAVIVTYFPKKEVLTQTVESICKQVSQVLIVDNTPNGSEFLHDYVLSLNEGDKIKIIPLNQNTGIAYAQNAGIRKALKDRADFILLSDEDTSYPVDYVNKMLEEYFKLVAHKRIAVIVPDFAELNRGGEKQGFVQFNNIFSRRIYPHNGYHEISQAIASGMLIPTKVFHNVGLMDEKLFIDWVDLEWCWRARAKGYKIIGCADVVIRHRMGDRAVKIGLHHYNMRAPIRSYYIVRNAVSLALRSKYLTFSMRLNILTKSIKYIVGFPILGKPHWKQLRYCLLGLWHGIRGKLGKLNYNNESN